MRWEVYTAWLGVVVLLTIVLKQRWQLRRQEIKVMTLKMWLDMLDAAVKQINEKQKKENERKNKSGFSTIDGGKS